MRIPSKLISPKFMLLWNVRPFRERVLIVSLAVFVVIVLLEFALYQPLRDTQAQMADRLARVTDEYRWLYVQSQKLKSIQNTLGNGKILMMSSKEKYEDLEEGLKQSRLKFSMREKTNEDKSKSAHITLRDVDGQALLKWVDKQVGDGYTLDNMSVTLLGEKRVRASVVFNL